MRVSGGHLCAQHRSTDRGGSRDFEPAALSASPPPCGSQNRLIGLERRAILTAAPLSPRFISHRERFGDDAQSRCALLAEKSSNPQVTAKMVEATGCGCPVDTSVHSTEAPTEAAAETLNLRPSRLRRHLAVPKIA